MSEKFVRSGAAGAGTGADWTNAYTTLTLAIAGISAGDTLWVADDHAESTAGAVTLTFPGTPASPNFVYCVDHTQASPGTGDLKTTATATTTGNSALTLAGTAYYYGIIFNCGTGAVAATITVGNTASTWTVLDACSLRKLGTTGIATAIKVNSGTANIAGRVRLNNTTMQFGAVGDSIAVLGGGQFSWQNTASAILGSLPTTLFLSNSFGVLEGIDLSALGSGKTLVGATSNSLLYFKDCKLGASVTVAATPTNPGPEVSVIRCDSGATNYRNEKYTYRGTETTETTITRVAGASDGVTAQSRKIVTTANVNWAAPFDAIPITVYVDVAAVSYTMTLEGTINAAAVPNNDDIWVEAEYLGSSANPGGSLATNTKANILATGSALTASSSSWNGGGSGAGWSPFQLAVTFTPQQAGWVTLYVKAAKATTTYYIDPRPTGLNIFKTYIAGSPSPVVFNQRDPRDNNLECIETGIAA